MTRWVSIFIICFAVFVTTPTYGQSQSTFKRTTATILFASIGGGVLGLSTLSFYGKPQEHTDNITTGVLIGFIAGVSYVAYDKYTDKYPQRQADNLKFEEWKNISEKSQLKSKMATWPILSFAHTW
ncbi:MAG: hypothetical protein JNL11_12680 [Bdellovibrionaceae bacterium]|nr:hypothetical protein [Pseudobdellovibrionaceae bacterium]